MAGEQLNRNLALFIRKVQKIDSSRYPPNTLHGIIALIQHQLKTHKRHIRFFHEHKFAYLKHVLDVIMKESASNGLGLAKKQEVITLDEEDHL